MSNTDEKADTMTNNTEKGDTMTVMESLKASHLHSARRCLAKGMHYLAFDVPVASFSARHNEMHHEANLRQAAKFAFDAGRYARFAGITVMRLHDLNFIDERMLANVKAGWVDTDEMLGGVIGAVEPEATVIRPACAPVMAPSGAVAGCTCGWEPPITHGLPTGEDQWAVHSAARQLGDEEDRLVMHAAERAAVLAKLEELEPAPIDTRSHPDTIDEDISDGTCALPEYEALAEKREAETNRITPPREHGE